MLETITPTELPQAIMLALAKDYEGTSVKEAYVKEKERIPVRDESEFLYIIICTVLMIPLLPVLPAVP
ncbi:hypothetical protein DW121_04575 [Bacteroides sp. AM10-21B]|nr:hypothetical protein DXC20_03800 [Bacteroides sp. OM08-17BH]RHJ52949.1 hypothetical protein DW121_04575 [Bacteroides sp. AM10-21B]HBO07811.1 hypothetical protein [Bacteroides sp.]